MPPGSTRVRRCALSPRRSAPIAWPAPRDGSTAMCSATYFARSGVNPRSRRMRGMSFANAGGVGYFLRVIASSSVSAVLRPPNSYQMSCGSSLRPSFCSHLLRGVGGERRLEDLDEHLAHAILGHLGRVERALDHASARSARTGRSRGRRGSARARARTACRARARRLRLVGLRRARRPRRCPPSATVTLFVNGFQSRFGLSITALRDRLRDDALHHLRDRALLREPFGRRSSP